MSDTITLTREEVREAREDYKNEVLEGVRKWEFGCFWEWRDSCFVRTPFCVLCKRLTEFAKGEEDE